MRLERIKIQNLGPFRDFAVDLTELPESALLVAVCGPNGAGKSTLLELATGGTAYRECETRGSLTALATARDAVLETTLVNGQRWTIRHAADAVSGKGEALVLDAEGEPATGSTKLVDFKAWSAKHLPPPEILYSSLVSVQERRGFIAEGRGDRKAILLRALGVERLEALAKDARERATDAQVLVGQLAVRISDEHARAENLDQLRVDRAAERGEAEHAERVRDETRAELEQARADTARFAATLEAYNVAQAARRRLEEGAGVVRRKLGELEERIRNNRVVLAEKEKIQEAVARVEQIRQQQVNAKTEAEAAERDAKAAWDRVHAAEAQMATALAATSAAGNRARVARERLGDIEKVRAAAASLEFLQSEVSAKEQGLRDDRGLLDELRGRRLVGAEDRIVDLRESLTEIHDSEDATAGALRTLAGSALERDDFVHAEANGVPRQIEQQEAGVRRIEDALAVARRRLSDAQALAARLPDVEAAAGDLEAAETEQREHGASATRYRDEARKHTADAEAHEARARGTSVPAADQDTLALAAKAPRLPAAEGRIAELEPQAAEARAEIDRLRAELDATPPPTRPSEPPSPDRLERLERQASEEHESHVRTIARLDQDIQAATEAGKRATALGAELDAASAELSDWTRLGRDLGRDGLQAMLVDSACAELTALCNDLLHEAFGPRWSVSFETQRLDSKGKRQLEGMDVRVLDTERGRDDFVESYSGGEKTILGEAVSLALTVLACRRYGFDRPTLVRDETSAALDAEKAVAYVAMLRRAATMLGADRVLLVSHSPDVQEMCDARIEL